MCIFLSISTLKELLLVPIMNQRLTSQNQLIRNIQLLVRVWRRLVNVRLSFFFNYLVAKFFSQFSTILFSSLPLTHSGRKYSFVVIFLWGVRLGFFCGNLLCEMWDLDLTFYCILPYAGTPPPEKRWVCCSCARFTKATWGAPTPAGGRTGRAPLSWRQAWR